MKKAVAFFAKKAPQKNFAMAKRDFATCPAFRRINDCAGCRNAPVFHRVTAGARPYIHVDG
jgi:hypothetical protein